MATVAISVTLVAVVTLVIFFFLSFDSLEYQEMGLNFSWISETVEDKPYTSGRYYLGIGNRFIKFPKMVKTIYFVEDMDNPPEMTSHRMAQPSMGTDQYQGPALRSRTLDGLNVRLEVSFQYKLKFDQLYELFTTLGTTYEHTLVRMAIEQLTTSATRHPAHFFFTNRTKIGLEMHKELSAHFLDHAFAEVPFFQLRTVHLPPEFEDAIRQTQVKQQEIQIAHLEQKTSRVTFQTQVLQAEQAVKVMMNQAEGEVASIQAANDAYCKQYQLTQELQAQALEGLMAKSGWNSNQLLDYLRIRAVREHPSEKTTIRI